MRKIWTAAAIVGAMLTARGTEIFLAGDSTMADYAAAQVPMTGWGQALKRYAKDGVKVRNFARGGRSSRSFRAEGRWDMLLNRVSPGDYVFIQFGHNDASKSERTHSDSETDFRENLRGYVRDVRKKGATPILCTPIVFMSFRDGKINQSEYFGKYSEAVRKVAGEEKVDLIDFNAWSQTELSSLGAEKAKGFYMILAPGKYPGFPKGRQDNCHLQEAGALFYAKGMISLAKAQNLRIAEFFNEEPSAVKPAAKPDDANLPVDLRENFDTFAAAPMTDAVADESDAPWQLLCQSGGTIPVCNDGALRIEHRQGALRIVSRARIVSGKFKARIRINEAVAPFNAFIGMFSIAPWAKGGASFHFNNPNLRANMTVDGKRKSTPPLKKGEWHELEIDFAPEGITYLLDGKALHSGPAPETKYALGAVFVINSRNGGKFDMDVDSMTFTGVRAGTAKAAR